MNRVVVTFLNMKTSEWLERDIRDRAGKLATYCPDMVACRVSVGKPHRHHEHGNRYDVHIDIVVPDEEIAVSRAPRVRGPVVEGARKDVRAVVRDAFGAARRQLQDYARRRRLSVKSHTARVAVART